jgi:Inner membrane component of T3SS, cytoplasmic domain
MAVDRGRLYFNSVLGGIGGLFGWAGTALVRTLMPEANVYVADACFGLVIGAAIGAAIGCAEGLIESPSPRRALIGAGFGALLGAVGGVIGLLLGEVLFNQFQGGVWARALGWALFGALVGTADGIVRKMPARIRYGALGGLIGGLIGGSTFDRLSVLLPGSTGNRELARAWGGAIGLIVLGACIGLMIGLVESLLRSAWLRFLTGRFEGQSRTIDPARAETTIGSSDSCNVFVVGDRSVAKVHAAIVVQNGTFVLQAREGSVLIDRGGVLPSASSYVLQPGDRLQLGSTRLLFQAAEASKS